MKGKYKNLRYYEHRPDNFSEDEKYPLIIHLPGAGYRGNTEEELEAFASYPLLKKGIEVAEEFPFVVTMPQCFADTWYDIFEQLKDFVLWATERPYIDKTRIYISGVSMGGYGAWQLLMSFPTLFAASIICCGGGMVWNTAKVKCPVWAFHGSLDDAVYCDEARRLVDRVNFYGGNAKLTVYEGVWHNCWDETFANPEIYKWLLSYKKGE